MPVYQSQSSRVSPTLKGHAKAVYGMPVHQSQFKLTTFCSLAQHPARLSNRVEAITFFAVHYEGAQQSASRRIFLLRCEQAGLLSFSYFDEWRGRRQLTDFTKGSIYR